MAVVRKKEKSGTGWITAKQLKEACESKGTQKAQLEYACAVVLADRELAENIRGVKLTCLPDIMEDLVKQSRVTQTKRDTGRNSGIETRRLEKESRNKRIRYLRFEENYTYEEIRTEMRIGLCDQTLRRVCKNETLS